MDGCLSDLWLYVFLHYDFSGGCRPSALCASLQGCPTHRGTHRHRAQHCSDIRLSTEAPTGIELNTVQTSDWVYILAISLVFLLCLWVVKGAWCKFMKQMFFSTGLLSFFIFLSVLIIWNSSMYIWCTFNKTNIWHLTKPVLCVTSHCTLRGSFHPLLWKCLYLIYCKLHTLFMIL